MEVRDLIDDLTTLRVEEGVKVHILNPYTLMVYDVAGIKQDEDAITLVIGESVN